MRQLQEDRDENDYEESSRQIAKFPEDIRLTGCVYEMECNTRVDSQPLALLKLSSQKVYLIVLLEHEVTLVVCIEVKLADLSR